MLQPSGADLEHNLGGGGARACKRYWPSQRGKDVGRCPLLRAKRGSFDFLEFKKLI